MAADLQGKAATAAMYNTAMYMNNYHMAAALQTQAYNTMYAGAGYSNAINTTAGYLYAQTPCLPVGNAWVQGGPNYSPEQGTLGKLSQRSMAVEGGQSFPGTIIQLARGEAQNFARAETKENTKESLLFFTDGSLFPGAGKLAGASAVYKNGHAWMEMAWGVTGHGNSIENIELLAIAGALEMAVNKIRNQRIRAIKTVKIFSDCLYAIRKCDIRPGLSVAPLVYVIQKRAQELVSLGAELSLAWVPAHCGIEGNELADQAAKRVARMAWGPERGTISVPRTAGDVPTFSLCNRTSKPAPPLVMPRPFNVLSRPKPKSVEDVLAFIEQDQKLMAKRKAVKVAKSVPKASNTAAPKTPVLKAASPGRRKKQVRMSLFNADGSITEEVRRKLNLLWNNLAVGIEWVHHYSDIIRLQFSVEIDIENYSLDNDLVLVRAAQQFHLQGDDISCQFQQTSYNYRIPTDGVSGLAQCELLALARCSSGTARPSMSPAQVPFASFVFLPSIVINISSNADAVDCERNMASASPSSSLSSPASFVTAHDSLVDKSTAASSPVQENPCPYRDARPLPRDLRAHCQIFLEEQLYTSAINLVNSIAASASSKRASTKKKHVPVPPPSHLALLNTLVIHPIHTSRAENKDHLNVSSQALDYLRNLLATVGPINADFKTAFQFRSVPRGGRRWEQHAPANDSDLSDAELSGDDERLRGMIANDSSVWHRGQDFWSTVGWAFNCSTLYPNRWRYWKVWLEFMLDVLEADWAERDRRDKEAQQASSPGSDLPQTSREESIVVMYMDQQNGRQNGAKGMMKALFADGSELSSSAYREVFEKEPRGPRKPSNKRKREQVLDLENDKFGDYFDDESMSSGVSEPPTPQKPRDTRKLGTAGIHAPGMVESISIRLRLFKLLSAVTFAMRKRSELHILYEEYTATLKLLPLPLFSLFVTQRPNALLPEAHITITKELFDLLLPSSYKNPAKIDPEGDAEGCLTIPMMEHCYVLHPANTVALDDNAKLSLVVENALQLLWACDMMEYSEGLEGAIEKGIKARELKVRKRRTGKMKGDPIDGMAQDVLVNSGERIRALLEAFKTVLEAES
ncbi:hypothetical protein FZEAL_10541 [Fusarium zealandicum]|uniref:RNase H type-1 domain-containing protein n=1 Tax=Fusarium zealandicum TaxID=1053134 RepID=A0A8H4U0M8_9HYPO|nr:hypothetical protein FZEAL_10541 [Fusarium zealandicum]